MNPYTVNMPYKAKHFHTTYGVTSNTWNSRLKFNSHGTSFNFWRSSSSLTLSSSASLDKASMLSMGCSTFRPPSDMMKYVSKPHSTCWTFWEGELWTDGEGQVGADRKLSTARPRIVQPCTLPPLTGRHCTTLMLLHGSSLTANYCISCLFEFRQI